MEKMEESDGSVIIPACSEGANIGNLVSEILALHPEMEGIGLYDDDPVLTQSRQAAKGFYFWLVTVLYFVFVIENKGIGN